MWEAIVSFFAENYPTLIWILVAVVVTWQASSLYQRFKKVEEVSAKVPCDKHHESIQGIQSNMPILKDIKESVRKIEEYIIKNDPNSVDVLLRKCSPYKITNLGEIVLLNSGARECIDLNADYFIGLIEGMNPLVALDVEQYALSVLNDNLKHDYFNTIKNYIYTIPDPVKITDDITGESTDVSIKLENILLIMSIYLRDKYFEKHPEIDISGFFEKK